MGKDSPPVVALGRLKDGVHSIVIIARGDCQQVVWGNWEAQTACVLEWGGSTPHSEMEKPEKKRLTAFLPIVLLN
jgi:hypothetical protein